LNPGTECSSNVETHLWRDIVEKRSTLQQNTAHEYSEALQRKRGKREAEGSTSNSNQLAHCEIAMSLSKICGKQDILSSDSREILDVNTDSFDIARKTEESQTTFEPEALPDDDNGNGIDIACQVTRDVQCACDGDLINTMVEKKKNNFKMGIERTRSPRGLKNTDEGLCYQRKTQTRSGTHSSGGGVQLVTSPIDDPNTQLRAPREKGEVFPERIKSSRFKEQRKAPNLDGLKSSILTRCAAADRVLHNQTIKTTGKHAIEHNNHQSRRANLKDDDTNKFQFEKAMEILPNRV
jgi:hypothetical protein